MFSFTLVNKQLTFDFLAAPSGSTHHMPALCTSPVILTRAWEDGPSIAAISQMGKLRFQSLRKLPLILIMRPLTPKPTIFPNSVVGSAEQAEGSSSLFWALLPTLRPGYSLKAG